MCVCVYVHGCVSAWECVDVYVPGCVFAWAEARESFSVAECFRERE